MKKIHTPWINSILFLMWDPIGCGIPEDEYKFYAEVITEMLDDNDIKAVAEFLCNIVEQWMFGDITGREVKVARLIYEIYYTFPD